MNKVLAIISGVVFTLAILVTLSSDPDPPPTVISYDPDPPPTIMPSSIELASIQNDDTYTL